VVDTDATCMEGVVGVCACVLTYLHTGKGIFVGENELLCNYKRQFAVADAV
jgi:hypothetical protein